MQRLTNQNRVYLKVNYYLITKRVGKKWLRLLYNRPQHTNSLAQTKKFGIGQDWTALLHGYKHQLSLNKSTEILSKHFIHHALQPINAYISKFLYLPTPVTSYYTFYDFYIPVLSGMMVYPFCNIALLQNTEYLPFQ